MPNENRAQSTLTKYAPYIAVSVISVLVVELLITWLGEGATWFNNFKQIVQYFCSDPPSQDEINTIITMLSIHHQSLANLLTIAGVIVTVITILFYLEGHDRKKELETHFQKFKELEKNFDDLNNRTREIAEHAEGMNECQQLIESILLHFWNIHDHTSSVSQEPQEQIKFFNDRLCESAEIKCILSKDEQFNGLGTLQDIVKKSVSENKKGAEQKLFSEVEQLLRKMNKIKRLSEENFYIANDILALMEREPLKKDEL